MMISASAGVARELCIVSISGISEGHGKCGEQGVGSGNRDQMTAPSPSDEPTSVLAPAKANATPDCKMWQFRHGPAKATIALEFVSNAHPGAENDHSTGKSEKDNAGNGVSPPRRRARFLAGAGRSGLPDLSQGASDRRSSGACPSTGAWVCIDRLGASAAPVAEGH